MTRLLIILSLLCLSIALKSQNFILQGQVYYGLFKMDDLKEIQADQLLNANLPLRMTREIGGYWGYEISGAKSLGDKSSLGIYLGLNSTGGRLHYSDFSGEAYINNKLFGTHAGVDYQIKLNSSDKLDFLLGFRVGVSFTNFESTGGIELTGAAAVINTSEFKSTSLHTGPSFQIGQQFDKLFIRAFTRYEFNFKAPLKLENGGILATPSGEQGSADWGGIRFGISVGTWL